MRNFVAKAMEAQSSGVVNMMHTAFPAIVIEYDEDKHVATIQPLFTLDNGQSYPQIQNVPVAKWRYRELQSLPNTGASMSGKSSYSGTVSSAGEHSHLVNGQTQDEGVHNHNISGSTGEGGSTEPAPHSHPINLSTSQNGEHGHQVSLNTETISNHSHDYSGNAESFEYHTHAISRHEVLVDMKLILQPNDLVFCMCSEKSIDSMQFKQVHNPQSKRTFDISDAVIICIL